jgi:hypothetical protein
MKHFLAATDHGEGVKPRPQEGSGLRRPWVSKCPAHTGQETIDSGSNPNLAASDIPFYPLPLACKAL